MGEDGQEELEENDHETYLRRSRFHETSGQVRTLHQANGSAIQEGECDASRVGCDGSAADHLRQEEPAKPNVHSAGCAYQGYEQLRERRVRERGIVGLRVAMVLHYGRVTQQKN